ncbi:MAG: hypothetical protein ACLP5H_20195 [Desulfomonilaceae bacterium]
MNRNSPLERQKVHASVLSILANREIGNLGASRTEIQRATGFSRRQVGTHLQWLKRWGLAENELPNFWTASPEHNVCWIHGDRLKEEAICPTCARNPKY